MTIGCEFTVKTIDLPGTNIRLELYLFDCGGQSIFNQRDSNNAATWKTASRIMVVFDCGKRDSFRKCAQWVTKVREMTGGPHGTALGNRTPLCLLPLPRLTYAP